MARPLARRQCRRALLIAFLSIATAAPPARAVEPLILDEAIQFQADEMTYDSRTKVTRASGNVVAVQNDRRMLADVVIYDELNDRVTAEGDVRLYEPTGEVITAASMEVTGDLKDGVIEDVRAILADGSRLTAERANREGGVLTTAERATYTPCLPCAEDPSRAPLWQVRSVRVTHDQPKRIVEFESSWLDISGVPVFYIPYLYQPDPTVKRKSGLLIPGFGQSSDLGFFTQVPYFAVLSDSQDLTLTPWLMTEGGGVLEAQYRQALKHGKIDFRGSGAVDTDGEAMGHIIGEARYDIDRDWRAGLNAERTTNRTYLRRYGFDDQRTLTSEIYAENFRGANDYLTARAMAFQNQNDDVDEEDTPYVAPWIDYYYVSDRDRLGGRTDLQLDTVALTRNGGADTRRMSARAQWQRPFVGPIGDVLTVSTALWGDGYDVDDQSTTDGDNRYTGVTGRIFPQAGAQWRLPLVRDGEAVQQIVEPIAEVILAPDYGNPSRIPNEDSQNFELQDTNLFGFNRLPGIDRVDEGPRVNYGLNYSVFAGGASAEAFVGQSYALYQNNEFGGGSGVQDNSSDIVSSLDLVPVPWLDVIYRNRLDHSSLQFRRNEFTTRVGVDAIRVGATYVRYSSQPENDLQAREEAQYTLNTRLSRFWSGAVFGTTDIESESQREAGLRVVYEDECFILSSQVSRQNFKDKDVEPSTVVFFRVGFKTLGDVGVGKNVGGG